MPDGETLRDAEPVLVPDDRGEVGDGQQGGAVRVIAEEGEDVVLARLAVDPGEPLRIGVALPEGGGGRVRVVEVADEVAYASVVGFGGVRGVEEPPVGAVALGPLRALGELLAHEEQLLAGVSPHETQVGAVVGALLPPVARHLPGEGALAVDDLVVGDRQDVVLAVRVDHRERHLVVVVLAVHRLLRHVLQGVVHPPHVPLQAEAEAAEAAGAHVVGGAGDAVPGGGLLGDGDDAGAAAVDGGVHLLEEGDGVQVLPAAIGVGGPFAGLAGVVEVEHGGDGVHAQAVDVELLAPVHGIGDEEVADLLAAVVELQGSPVGVRGPCGVLVLVQRAAVELGERPVVLGEVRRHPVHEDADAGPVQGVHEELEVVGGAEAGRRRVEARDLVAPRAAERMLGHRHQLYVREAQVRDVGRELFGKLTVCQAWSPGREVEFVDGER